MLSEREVINTLNMLRNEHLDVRTVTLGVSLFDCVSHDIDLFTGNVKAKLHRYASQLVNVCNEVGDKYGIPVVNKRISVSPIAVVGAREPTAYGRRWAEQFGMELAGGGALVVSGIAQGLDTCAVRGALKGGGPVACVLAGGVNVPYPVQNRFLYDDVAAAGVLVSEYPPGAPHDWRNFPRRNRILSGLCLGVLAVECRPFGGTMSTVNHAVEQDRDVFAVPGALDAPMSEGTNRLIQQGAKLVTCGRDILEEYWGRFPDKLGRAAPLTPEAARARMADSVQVQERERAAQQADTAAEPEPAPAKSGRELIPRSEQKRRFTDDELALLAALKDGERTADQLVELTQIPAKRVLSALTMLQIQAAVAENPGRRFSALVELEE